MRQDLKIDYLELPASDFPAIQSFYQTCFDWEFTDYGPDYCAFADGHMEGGFYRSEQQSQTQSGATLIVLYALDLEATLERVRQAGGTICREITSFPGGRRFQFLDPHGNELAVWSDQGMAGPEEQNG